MEVRFIHEFVKECIKDDGVAVLLNAVVEQYQQQKKEKFFLLGGTQVNQTDEVRYVFYAIPDDKEAAKIQKAITKVIQDPKTLGWKVKHG